MYGKDDERARVDGVINSRMSWKTGELIDYETPTLSARSTPSAACLTRTDDVVIIPVNVMVS